MAVRGRRAPPTEGGNVGGRRNAPLAPQLWGESEGSPKVGGVGWQLSRRAGDRGSVKREDVKRVNVPTFQRANVQTFQRANALS